MNETGSIEEVLMNEQMLQLSIKKVHRLEKENAELNSVLDLTQLLIPNITQIRENYLHTSLEEILSKTSQLLSFEKADIVFMETAGGTLPLPVDDLDPERMMSNGYQLRTYISWGRTQQEVDEMPTFTLAQVLGQGKGTWKALLLDHKCIHIYNNPEYIKQLIEQDMIKESYIEEAQEEWDALDEETKDSYKNSFSNYLRSILFPLTRIVGGTPRCFGFVGFDSPLDTLKLQPHESIPEERVLLAQRTLNLIQHIISITSFYDMILQQRNALDRAFSSLKEAQAAIILQEKLSSLGMLSASIAHGVANPLFALSVSTRRLEELTSRLGTDWQKLESQGLSAEDRCTLQELLATVG
jgi:hypothetical protein